MLVSQTSQMAEEKVRSIHHEARQRSTRKKICKIRYSFWLQNHQQYCELQQKFLYLVACCKFNERSFKSRQYFLQQLQLLLWQYYNNWNAYIIITEQVIQLNLFSLFCQCSVHTQIICNFGTLLILNQGFTDILNQNLRDAVQQNRSKLIADCYEEMFIMLMIDSCSRIHLRTKQQHISQLDKQTSITNTMICLLSQFISTNQEKIINNQPIVSTMLQLLQLSCSTGSSKKINIITLLSEYITNNHNLRMGNNLITKYLQYVKFLLQVYNKYLCGRSSALKEMHQNNEKQTNLMNHSINKKDNSQMLLISNSIIKMLNSIFNNDQVQLLYRSNIKNVITLLKLMRNCKIFDESWQNILNFALNIGLNGKVDDNNNKNNTFCRNEEQVQRLTTARQQSIYLLMELCFQQQWVCYSHFRKHIITLLKLAKNSQQHNLINLFSTTQETLHFNPSSSQQKLCVNSQNILLNIIQNLLINQYHHHCDFDYYEMLQIVFEDLFDAQVMKKWSTDSRYVENFQFLFERLSNVKKAKYKADLTIIGEDLLRSKYVNNRIKKKIKLMKRLYILTMESKKKGMQLNEANHCCNLWERCQVNQQQFQDEGEDGRVDSEDDCSGDDTL